MQKQKGVDSPEKSINRKKESRICLSVLGWFFFLSSRVSQLLDRFSRKGREPWISTHTLFPFPPLQSSDLSRHALRDGARQSHAHNTDIPFLTLAQVRAEICSPYAHKCLFALGVQGSIATVTICHFVKAQGCSCCFCLFILVCNLFS